MAGGAGTKSAKVVGRYVLYDRIAAGGMATVRLGRLLGTAGFARTVAVKQLHPQYALDEALATMLLDEARIAARIRHPNVVPVLDVVGEDGEILLVMEYVHGAPLSRLVRHARERGEAVPPAIAAAVAVGALEGLHAAHEARGEQGEPLNVVHRDVSPDNVLVGVDGVARVLDFGIAKAVGRAQTTRDGQLKGKMAYMAPEQLKGLGVDRRTDVYSASVVLWEMLAGRTLFDGLNDVAVFGKVLAGAECAPSALVPGVGAALDAIVMRGLALDRNARFATARDMAQELARVTPVADVATVGEWVTRLATRELADRAALVAAVERGEEPIASRDDGAGAVDALLQTDNDAPLPLVKLPSEPETQFMASRMAALTTPRTSRREWLAVGVVAALLTGGIVALVVRRSGPSEDELRPAVAPAVATVAAPTSDAAGPAADLATRDAGPGPTASTTPAVSAVSGMTSVTPSATPSTGATATKVPLTAPGPKAKPAPTPKPLPKAAPAPKPKSDCDPPYYFDATGTKRYKRECG